MGGVSLLAPDPLQTLEYADKMLESAWQLGSAASARGACFTPRQTTQASVALPSRALRTAGARRIPALPLPWPRRLHGVRQRAVHMEGVAGRCYSDGIEHPV